MNKKLRKNIESEINLAILKIAKDAGIKSSSELLKNTEKQCKIIAKKIVKESESKAKIKATKKVKKADLKKAVKPPAKKGTSNRKLVASPIK